jgi:3-deoxy-D-manno-octulosonate 8-phosphate phosphatase (KDO 8-P phosphatase)
VNSAATHNRLAELRLVAFDVDGVFTDGRFYLSDEGVESKAFNTQDGFGVRRLIEAGFQVAVISGRTSAATAQRMAELGIRHVILGSGDKVAVFDKLIADLGLDAAVCAYAGDDIPDLPLLKKVGYSIAVANAVEEVRDFCDYTTMAEGGRGAVREICDLVLTARPGTDT